MSHLVPISMAIDVAQTCVPRAGCGWYADSLARAIHEAVPKSNLQLLHHFGEWINVSTVTGTDIDSPTVASPLRYLNTAAAHEFWQTIERGKVALPGSPEIVQSCSFHAPQIPGAKLVYTVHDLSFWTHPDFSTGLNRLVCQRELLKALANAAAFVFASEAAHQEFEEVLPRWLEENSRPFRVIPHASRFRAAPESPPPTKGSPWLCVGSIEPRKNHRTLLQAYAIYQERSLQKRPLVIAGGSGWMSDDVHRLLNENPTGNITYLGYVDDERLQRCYEDAFAVVFPSWHEGFGLPVLEGMTFGLPVICSKIPALIEAGGSAPAYVDPSCPRSIAEAMLTLESDPEGYRGMVEKSHQRASAFSWKKTANAYLDFYRELLENTKSTDQ